MILLIQNPQNLEFGLDWLPWVVTETVVLRSMVVCEPCLVFLVNCYVCVLFVHAGSNSYGSERSLPNLLALLGGLCNVFF